MTRARLDRATHVDAPAAKPDGGRLNRQRHVIMLIVTVVVIVGTFLATLLSGSRPQLGLDLQGGISVVLFPVKGSDLTRSTPRPQIIRNRVDGLGVAEPDVSRQGNTIVVDLPGREEPPKPSASIGQTAELRFRRSARRPVPWARRPRRAPRRQGRDHHEAERTTTTGSKAESGPTTRSTTRARPLGAHWPTDDRDHPDLRRPRPRRPTTPAATTDDERGATTTTPAAPTTTVPSGVPGRARRS